MTAVALTIAGSDPGGGAGIQADLRTFNALSVVGLSAVTALTVQNSQGVQSVHPVPADVLAAQLDAVLSDTRPDAVKIGMLGGADQVRAVAAALRRYQPPNVVLDPVLASTGGIPLLDTDGHTALIEELLPLCDLVTPNLQEAEALSGISVSGLQSAVSAGEHLLQTGVTAVLVKGGHLPEEPTDTLLDSGGHRLFLMDVRVQTVHTHGTGCLLSSALAALLAKHFSLREAATKAKELVTRALTLPVQIGRGRGYPDIMAAARTNRSFPYRTHWERLALLKGVYVLTDSDLRPDRSAEDIVRAARSAGATVVQLREKRLNVPGLVRLAQHLSTLVPATDGLFIVNDRVDIALASGADGVHLGPDDLTPGEARAMLGPDRLVGISVNSVTEAEAAAPYASYFGVGAIYGSKTKRDAGAPIGLEPIRQIKAAFPQIPVVAIGGINTDNIGEVAAAGADAAAVVSAVVTAPDMAVATRDLMRRFNAGKSRA